MSYFTHHFETAVALHPVGTYNYTVVYLPPDIAATLPFSQAPRLRTEADVAGVPVKGAWQPSGGRWYLMLPKAPLRRAGLRIGSVVEVAFRLSPQDEVDLPAELAELLASQRLVSEAWQKLTAGKQRGLAYMVSSAKKPETRAAHLAQVQGIVLGELPEPWHRKAGTSRGEA
jgi:hypothetical protein